MKNFMLGVLFLIAGIVAAFFGKGMLQEAGESETWPSVSGVIVESRVEKGRRYDSSSKRTKTVYQAVIDYEYRVDGKKYFGDQISFGGTSTDRKAAYKLTSKYPKKKPVAVYYKPDAPENAVLETGASWLTYMPLGIGLLFALIGVIMVIKPVFKILFVAVLALAKR